MCHSVWRIRPNATRYPDIVVDCVLTDSHSDVIDERIDIEIRFGFLPDNRYVARELAKVNFYSVGTPELIDKVGMLSFKQSMNELSVLNPLQYLMQKQQHCH